MASCLARPTDTGYFGKRSLPQLLTLRSQLETLYCESNGRPAIDPVLLCGVTLLQFMEKVSDRRAAEQVAYHLGWKYALDLELPYEWEGDGVRVRRQKPEEGSE